MAPPLLLSPSRRRDSWDSKHHKKQLRSKKGDPTVSSCLALKRSPLYQEKETIRWKNSGGISNDTWDKPESTRCNYHHSRSISDGYEMKISQRLLQVLSVDFGTNRFFFDCEDQQQSRSANSFFESKIRIQTIDSSGSSKEMVRRSRNDYVNTTWGKTIDESSKNTTSRRDSTKRISQHLLQRIGIDFESIEVNNNNNNNNNNNPSSIITNSLFPQAISVTTTSLQPDDVSIGGDL
jgi:hypothetical protein